MGFFNCDRVDLGPSGVALPAAAALLDQGRAAIYSGMEMDMDIMGRQGVRTHFMVRSVHADICNEVASQLPKRVVGPFMHGGCKEHVST